MSDDDLEKNVELLTERNEVTSQLSSVIVHSNWCSLTVLVCFILPLYDSVKYSTLNLVGYVAIVLSFLYIYDFKKLSKRLEDLNLQLKDTNDS